MRRVLPRPEEDKTNAGLGAKPTVSTPFRGLPLFSGVLLLTPHTVLTVRVSTSTSPSLSQTAAQRHSRRITAGLKQNERLTQWARTVEEEGLRALHAQHSCQWAPELELIWTRREDAAEEEASTTSLNLPSYISLSTVFFWKGSGYREVAALLGKG
jgi:hypothetical protein